MALLITGFCDDDPNDGPVQEYVLSPDAFSIKSVPSHTGALLVAFITGKSSTDKFKF